MKLSDTVDRRKETIKSKAVEVLDALGIETENRGEYSRMACPCPDHDDKKPSAALYFDSGHFECFGCGWSGDSLDLIALVRGLDIVADFGEVLDEGAALLGLPSPIVQSGYAGSSLSKVRAKEKENRVLDMELAKQEVERIVQESPDRDLSAEDVNAQLQQMSPVPISVDWSEEDEARSMVLTLFADERAWLGRFSENGVPVGDIIDVSEDSLNSAIVRIKRHGRDLRLTPSTYQDKEGKRRSSNVEERRYVVLEMDKLRGRDPESCGEIDEMKLRSMILVKWLTDNGQILPVAVVDSGNKSIHVWVEAPAAEMEQDILDQVEAMGFDMKSYKNRVGPFRLPGCVHSETGCEARLLWLAQPSGSQGNVSATTNGSCVND